MGQRGASRLGGWRLFLASAAAGAVIAVVAATLTDVAGIGYTIGVGAGAGAIIGVTPAFRPGFRTLHSLLALLAVFVTYYCMTVRCLNRVAAPTGAALSIGIVALAAASFAFPIAPRGPREDSTRWWHRLRSSAPYVLAVGIFGFGFDSIGRWLEPGEFRAEIYTADCFGVTRPVPDEFDVWLSFGEDEPTSLHAINGVAVFPDPRHWRYGTFDVARGTERTGEKAFIYTPSELDTFLWFISGGHQTLPSIGATTTFDLCGQGFAQTDRADEVEVYEIDATPAKSQHRGPE